MSVFQLNIWVCEQCGATTTLMNEVIPYDSLIVLPPDGREWAFIQRDGRELLRDDVVKWLAKHRKEQRKVGVGSTATQGDLLLPANA